MMLSFRFCRFFFCPFLSGEFLFVVELAVIIFFHFKNLLPEGVDIWDFSSTISYLWNKGKRKVKTLYVIDLTHIHTGQIIGLEVFFTKKRKKRQKILYNM